MPIYREGENALRGRCDRSRCMEQFTVERKPNDPHVSMAPEGWFESIRDGRRFVLCPAHREQRDAAMKGDVRTW